MFRALWGMDPPFQTHEKVSPRSQLTHLRTESILLFAIDPNSGAVNGKTSPRDRSATTRSPSQENNCI